MKSIFLSSVDEGSLFRSTRSEVEVDNAETEVKVNNFELQDKGEEEVDEYDASADASRQGESCLGSNTCPVCRMCLKSNALFAAHSLFHMQGDKEYVDGENHLVCCPVVALSGLVRNYRLWSDNAVMDDPTWLREQYELLRQCLLPPIRVFLVRAMFYTRIRFMSMDPVSGVVVTTRDVYLPSGPTSHTVDLNEGFESHVERFSITIEKYIIVEGSAWEVNGLEHVLLKVSLSENFVGCGVSKLPAKLRKMCAVINVDCEHACFKYAVLRMLHCDVKKGRRIVSV